MNKDFNESGMLLEEIEDYFNKQYPKLNNISFLPLDTDYKLEEINQWKKYIYDDIYYGYAALGGIKRIDSTQHCIVYAKDKQGELYLIDAQDLKIYKGNYEILNYLLKNKTNKIYKLMHIFKFRVSRRKRQRHLKRFK